MTGLVIVIVIVLLFYLLQKQRIKKTLRRCSEKIMKNTKKQKGDELILKKHELENKLKTVNFLEILQLKKEVDNFEIRVEDGLLKRKEIINSIKELLNRKIDEISRTIDNDQDEWNNILLEKDKIENENGDEYSIDYTFNLFHTILKFEENHLKKIAITREMTSQQQKDFEKLRKLFITGEELKEEDKRNRIKSKCEELQDRYHKELHELKLKNNTKKLYVALLLISGKLDNADIEETMNFNRVSDDRYNIHENLKQITNRNALLEQLFENTKPKK
jgi:hypothetical protein